MRNPISKSWLDLRFSVKSDFPTSHPHRRESTYQKSKVELYNQNKSCQPIRVKIKKIVLYLTPTLFTVPGGPKYSKGPKDIAKHEIWHRAKFWKYSLILYSSLGCKSMNRAQNLFRPNSNPIYIPMTKIHPSKWTSILIRKE